MMCLIKTLNVPRHPVEAHIKILQFPAQPIPEAITSDNTRFSHPLNFKRKKNVL
jgi:hypothetical protein